jgi:alpha-L-fucosidase
MKKQTSYNIAILVIFCAAVVSLSGRAEANDEFLPPVPDGKTWKLAWSDEFDGTQIDQSKWEIMGDWKRRDGFWVKEDSYLDGKGNLLIRTKKDGDRYTSGAVRTRGKFEHKFGYWVCRCKFPTQEGHWPAFWLMAEGVSHVGDEGRDGTEIDIMEKPWREDKTTQNLHWDGYGKAHKSAGTGQILIPGLSEGFHTFGLHWTPEQYVFYVDGKETWRTIAGGVSQVPEYAKLTEEIGKWGGDIAKADLPDYFVVDYVRVYDEMDTSAPAMDAQTKDLIERAANVRPSPQQLAWQKLEFIAFIHYTVNAFTDREWGEGTEDEAIFNPTQLDVHQWVRTCKDAGMKMIILTAKHHDGFCLWPSKYTEHSVKNSPYKGGKGDIVGELAQACRQAGLKLGLYLSPWDRHEPTYGTDAYNDFYKNQLREILSNYGRISEVWFDGAKGPNAKNMEYDWAGYYAIVRELQPDAVIFNGPDIRWVGNESGYARESEWSVVNSNGSLFGIVNCTQKDLGSLKALGDGERLVWYPAETDVSIRPGWFYHANQDDKVKSVETLLDIYFKSVSRNSVLLLNLPPDKRGLIHENDVKRLHEFRKALDAIFDKNLAAGAKATASNVRGGESAFAAGKITDGDPETYWMTDDWTPMPTVEFDLGKECTFNVAELAEHIEIGQRIAQFVLEVPDGAGWKQFAGGTTVGYKRLLRFEPMTASKVRLRILDSRICPTLSSFGLYFAPPVR